MTSRLKIDIAQDQANTSQIIILVSKVKKAQFSSTNHYIEREHIPTLSREELSIPTTTKTLSFNKFYIAKNNLLSFLKFGHYSWITNPNWTANATVRAFKFQSKWDWDISLGSLIEELKQLRSEALVSQQKRRSLSKGQHIPETLREKRRKAGKASGRVRAVAADNLEGRVYWKAHELIWQNYRWRNIATIISKDESFSVSSKHVRSILKPYKRILLEKKYNIYNCL